MPVKKQEELVKGQQVHKFNPNELTIVDSKHPLAAQLFLNRNNTKYEKGSQAVTTFVEQGQLQPIGVFPYKNTVTGKDELVVAFGNQRTLMCRAAGITVDAVVFRNWTVDDAEQAMIAENCQREDLSFSDMLMSVIRRIAFHKAQKTKNGYGEVAKEFNKSSHQWARDMEAISKLPAKIRKQIPNSLSPTTALQLTKYKTPEEQMKAYQELLEDENAVSQKGGKIKASSASRKSGAKKDTLSKKEWLVIAANPEIDFSELSDEDVRLLIKAVLGEIDITEAQRAGLAFVKHVDTKKKGKSKPAAAAPKKKVNIDELVFDDDEDDEEDVDEVDEDDYDDEEEEDDDE